MMVKCRRCRRDIHEFDVTIYNLCTKCRDEFRKTKAYRVLQEILELYDLAKISIVIDYSDEPVTAIVSEGCGAGVMNPASWSYLVLRGKEKSKVIETEKYDVGSAWTGYKETYDITVEQEKFEDGSSIAILVKEHTSIDYRTSKKLIAHFYF